jgi:hypothetical protein
LYIVSSTESFPVRTKESIVGGGIVGEVVGDEVGEFVELIEVGADETVGDEEGVAIELLYVG